MIAYCSISLTLSQENPIEVLMNFASLMIVAEFDNFVGSFVQRFMISYKNVYVIEMPKEYNYSKFNQGILLLMIIYCYDFYLFYNELTSGSITKFDD